MLFQGNAIGSGGRVDEDTLGTRRYETVLTDGASSSMGSAAVLSRSQIESSPDAEMRPPLAAFHLEFYEYMRFIVQGTVVHNLDGHIDPQADMF